MRKGPPRSYLILAALACGVLFWVLRLSGPSSPGPARGPVDYGVIALVGMAIAYNLIQLGRRLYASGGSKSVWHLQRTLLFWVIGLLNTAWARPEDLGSWKSWAGGALLVVALFDSVALLRKELASTQPAAPSA